MHIIYGFVCVSCLSDFKCWFAQANKVYVAQSVVYTVYMLSNRWGSYRLTSWWRFYFFLPLSCSCSLLNMNILQFLTQCSSSTGALSLGLHTEAFSFVFLITRKTAANRGDQTAQNCWQLSKSGCLEQPDNRYCQALLRKLFGVTVCSLASTWDGR